MEMKWRKPLQIDLERVDRPKTIRPKSESQQVHTPQLDFLRTPIPLLTIVVRRDVWDLVESIGI